MPQSKMSVSGLNGKEDAEKLVNATADVSGVRFVNVNLAQGFIVVTHSDDFDEAAFKAAVTAAGFGV